MPKQQTAAELKRTYSVVLILRALCTLYILQRHNSNHYYQESGFSRVVIIFMDTLLKQTKTTEITVLYNIKHCIFVTSSWSSVCFVHVPAFFSPVFKISDNLINDHSDRVTYNQMTPGHRKRLNIIFILL